MSAGRVAQRQQNSWLAGLCSRSIRGENILAAGGAMR
jgi:hypothetical protein